MPQTTNQDLEDELTERDVHLERYKRGVAARVMAMLERVEEDVLNQLQKIDPTASAKPSYRRARLTRLLSEVQGLIEQYATALNRDVLPELTELARDESAFGVRMLSSLPPVALEVVAPSVGTLVAAATSRPFQGRLLREWVAEHPAAVRMRLRNAIRMGVSQGETIEQIVRRIRGTAKLNYRDGVMEVNRRGAEAMVRTAVNHVVSAAREATYVENSDLIKGVKWVATLDSRTSETCRGLDGQVFPLDRGPRPPAHVNCRSSTVPVMKSWKELGISLGEAPEGTRASMDGQVAAGQTYSTWLRKRSAEFQDDVLGKTKGALFRRGDLELDRFIDSNGRAYTLKELRKREPAAFARAGV